MIENKGGMVTVVIQTRARPGQDQAFSHWQSRIKDAVAAQPGFLDQSIVPSHPPTQPDGLTLMGFRSMAPATAWLQSEQRRALLLELEPMLIGVHDVHLLPDPSLGRAPPPVCAMITMRVAPARATEFRAWQERLVIAESRFPGFLGYRFEQPLPGLKDDWIA